MATPTYDLLDSTTLASSASSVTFTSIDQSYGDLIVVCEYKAASGSGFAIVGMRFNSDSGNNYNDVVMSGDGSSASSSSNSSGNGLEIVSAAFPDETDNGLVVVQIMDYSATDKHKSVLSRSNVPLGTFAGAEAVAGRWADTSAITSIEIYNRGAGDEFASGATFSLYGIAK